MKSTQLAQVSRVRALAKTGDARKIREDAGVSLREAAGVIKAAPSTLMRWEAAEACPRPAGALRWAQLLAELAGAPV